MASKKQRTWGKEGASDRRFFWDVTLVDGTQVKNYRSRISESKKVKAYLKSRGLTASSVRKAMA